MKRKMSRRVSVFIKRRTRHILWCIYEIFLIVFGRRCDYFVSFGTDEQAENEEDDTETKNR
jgi:hypothetical protein